MHLQTKERVKEVDEEGESPQRLMSPAGRFFDFSRSAQTSAAALFSHVVSPRLGGHVYKGARD